MKKFWKGLATALCALAISGLVFSGCSDGGGDGGNRGDGLAAGGSYSVLTAERKAVTAPDTAGTIALTIGTGAPTPYATIQAALTAAQGASDDCVITLGSGTYAENGLTYTGSANLTISGQGTAEYGLDVLIKGHGLDNSSEQGRALFEITGSGDVILENLTIQNDEGMTEGTAQREVLATDGTGNLAAYNCSFLSGQDTLRTVAKAWFYHCYIEGDVDFLWIEYTGGIAALYEDCVIRAIGTRTTSAYFTAPRLGLTSKVGKGLVIYNSTLQAESGLTKLYLGRNPWSSNGVAQTDYYEQVAVISSPLYLASGVTLTDAWASPANGTSDQAYIGFKTDAYYAKSEKYGTRIGDTFIAKEYAGRENILNRLYSVGSAKFVKDNENYWNVAAIAQAKNWSVAADSSQSLLDGEKEIEATVYDFSTAGAGAYVDETVTIDGFTNHTSKTATGGAEKTITIPVSGKSLITVKGCYSGWGTIKAGTQGEGVYCFETGSTSKWAENTYVVYDESATSVVITAATTTYIQKVTVEKDATLSYTPVNKIEVSSKATSYTVGVPVTLTATVSPDTATNAWVKWTSGDEEVGTIDAFTGVAKFLKAGSVTFTATARDGSGKTGTITCTPAEATWTSAEWYDTGDSSSATSSGAGTSLGGSGGENNTVFDVTGASGVTLGKVITVTDINGEEVSISRGIKMNSSGIVTFSVTRPAKVTVLAAYCSDSNATSDTVKIDPSTNVTPWSTNPTEVPNDDATYIWQVPVGTYTVSRAGAGYAPAIYYVRVDIGEFEEEIDETLPVLSADNFADATVTLDLNDTKKTTKAITARSSDEETPVITYKSSRESVATVNASTGEVTAVGMGSAEISAEVTHPTNSGVQKVTKKYTVLVKATAVEDEYTLDLTAIQGTAGDYGKFVVTGGNYHNGHGWIMQNGHTLTVKVNGSSKVSLLGCQYSGTTLPTVKAGETTLSTSATSAKVTACKDLLTWTYTGTDAADIVFTFGGTTYVHGVTVAPHTVSTKDISIAFAAETVTLDVSSESDKTTTKIVTVSGSDAADASVTYASSVPAVATVDSTTGVVTAVGVGKTIITATDATTEKTATYTVTVKQNTATESMYFDFRGTGIVTNTSAAEAFDFGILTGSAKSHGYGLAGATTVKFTVLGPSKIWFAQMDYGGDYAVTSTVGEAEAVSVGTVSTLGTVGDKKCSASTLAEAITQGNVASVTYKGSESALIMVTGNQYLSRIWVEKYEAPSISIAVADFADSITKEIDLSSGSTTATNTTTATVTGATGTPTIAYTSSHPAVATVDSSSGLVTAVSIGTTTITATASFDGAESATKSYVLTVKKTTAVDNDVFDFRQALNSLSGGGLSYCFA